MPEGVRLPEHHVARAMVIATGALVVGGALYKHLKPEKSFDPGENYFDIIDNLDDCITAGAGPDVGYVMIGGGVSAALRDPGTRVDIQERRVVPPANITKPQFREDTGTKADIDILVFSTDKTVIDAVRHSLTPHKSVIETGTDAERSREISKPGAKLKVGVTGLRPNSDYDDQPANLLQRVLTTVKKDWVSHRLEDDDGSRSVAISDVRVDLPAEYYDTWQLELKSGKCIPVLHPLLQVLCYPSRASHGVRLRDKDKIYEIMHNFGDLFGARLDWGHKNQTANVVLSRPVNDGVAAAADFCEQKNNLRWKNTKDRLGRTEAAILAARIAFHRQLDSHPFFEQFGQDGWLFDHVVSRFSGEEQREIDVTAAEY